ncbi:MAG: hypothetical protein R2688_07400 [Fimbriimonadaceae bacterium]
MNSSWALNYRPLKSKFALPGDAYEVARLTQPSLCRKDLRKQKNLLTTL